MANVTPTPQHRDWRQGGADGGGPVRGNELPRGPRGPAGQPTPPRDRTETVPSTRVATTDRPAEVLVRDHRDPARDGVLDRSDSTATWTQEVFKPGGLAKFEKLLSGSPEDRAKAMELMGDEGFMFALQRGLANETQMQQLISQISRARQDAANQVIRNIRA